jgi:heme/copper-type cytochrome/quinol oxidase subunit 3
MNKNNNKLASDYFQRPLSNQEKAWPRVVLGVVFLIFSWYFYINPESPPFSGKSRWFSELMYTHLGVHGMPIGLAMFGVLLILWGLYDASTFKQRNKLLK